MREALSKYRIQPGNVGKGAKRDRQFAQMIEAAMRYDKPVRIGVNWGSLDQELLARVDGRERPARRAVGRQAGDVPGAGAVGDRLGRMPRAESGMERDQIIISCKVSGVQDLVSVYRALAARCDYALHLGLTEAGMAHQGHGGLALTALARAAAREGIGDTIRVR